jgi:hypothetical protein
MSTRRTYKFTVETSVQLDDETLHAVERLIQEHINIMYHSMAREDIRVILQHKLEVTETL